MRKVLQVVSLLLLTSFYLFPVNFAFFPAANSKMLLAVVGLVLLFLTSISKKDIGVSKDVVMLSVMAGLVSLSSIVSITLNNTNDFSYVGYIVSMWVWLSAAYVVCSAILKVHAKNDVIVVCNYIVGVCAIQCLIALGVEFVPAIKQFVDAIVLQGQESLTKGNRLYGLGASLDTAGTRFALSLVIISYVVCTKTVLTKKQIWFYTASYFLILIVGNMIARTTLVGAIISIALLLWIKRRTIFVYNRTLLLALITFLLISSGYVTHLYNNNLDFRELVRFGFEPFFNFFEGGEFATESNQMLKNMYVFPKTLHTWLIGDGYFNNPHTHDPYYVGQTSKYGYYMGTDVGYLRLIFYFGLLGLISFIAFLIYATNLSSKKLSEHKILFMLTLFLGFIIWLKVATDLFFVMALFVCVANVESEDIIKSE